MATATGGSCTGDAAATRPPLIGIIGGAFNPIHLGHVLLAVTVRETKPVDEVVLVPVFRHPVKTDLLPYEDRVAMCELALQGKGIGVSTIERETKESNVVMLRALRARCPAGAQLLWVCGDDVFDWIDNAKGQAMLRELDGLIVQRRLHRTGAEGKEDSFYQCPMDMARLGSLGEWYSLKIDVIFGELPHFSSTLVRSSPASWRAYLPLCVATYLEERPHLLTQVLLSSSHMAEAGAPMQKRQRQDANKNLTTPLKQNDDGLQEAVTACIMQCIAAVHGLQRERGCTAVALSTRSAGAGAALRQARETVDGLLRDLPAVPVGVGDAHCMAEELAYTPEWLARDRRQLDRHLDTDEGCGDEERHASAWLRRVALLRKYNARIDVLLEACAQVLETRVAPTREALRSNAHTAWSQELVSDVEGESDAGFLLRLFCLWARGKEALGRERAFVCAGGHDACRLVRSSLRLRSQLHDVIEHKEFMLERIFTMERAGPAAGYMSAGALHAMLARITAMEWSLMGCFAASTPQHVQHRVIACQCDVGAASAPATLVARGFNSEGWWQATGAAIDLMLTLVQGLAAGICMARAPAASCDAAQVSTRSESTL